MKINMFFYSLKQGIANIGRNKMFSIASIATMGACIFLFGIFYIVVVNFSSMVKSAQESVAVTVFFDEGIEQEQIDKIGEEIDKRAEVSEKKFVSAEQAWEDYKEEYFEGYDEELIASFNGDNPLENSANYQIYLNDISMQSSLVSYLEGLEGVRKVEKSEVVEDVLTDVNKLLGYISGGIILILLGVAIFLISNTVTVGISVRKEEIAIMRLIGASDYLVRSPFVVEGVVIGIIGAGIPLVLLYFLYHKIINYVGEQFVSIGSMFEFMSVQSVFKTLVPVALLLGVGIGFIGSRLTVKKHLKV